MFVAMGLSAIVPIVHGMIIYGIERLDRQIGLYWMLLEGALYVTGAGLYAVRLSLSIHSLRLATSIRLFISSLHHLLHRIWCWNSSPRPQSLTPLSTARDQHYQIATQQYRDNPHRTGTRMTSIHSI